jgi:hypothetical protein
MFSCETFGAVFVAFFSGFTGEGFLRAFTGVDGAFFADFFCWRFFSAAERLAFCGRARRDFAAAGFLRFRAGFLRDFDFDLEAIRDSRVQLRRGWPGERALTPVFDGLCPAMKRWRLGINGASPRQAGRKC